MKIILQTILIGFFFLPIMVFAANDVNIVGNTNFEILTADTAAPVVITTSAGQVTDFNINSNYIDITINNLSTVTFTSTTSNIYFRITKISGSNDYSLVSPSCPTTTITLSGSGATVVLRLEIITTYSCAVSTTTPLVSSGGVGGFIPPAPLVFNFNAIQSGNDVILSWNNPNDINFASVRITRSTNFYPTNPNDGVMVYSGIGQSAIDFNLSYDKNYYYSAFSYNKSGGVSNPVITSVFLVNPKKDQTPIVPSIPIYEEEPVFPIIPTVTSTTVVTTTIKATSSPFLSFFNYYQDGEEPKNLSKNTNIKANVPLVITSNVEKVHLDIKNFVLTIKDPTDITKSNSYLFVPDKSGNIFQVTVPKFVKSGIYKYTITAYNFDNGIISVVQGNLNVESKIDWKIFLLPFIILIIFLLFIFLILWLAWREHQKREREKVLNTWKGF